MPSAQRTVTINRPIADVFAFLADAENDPKWRPAVKEIKRVGPPGAGARYEQKVAGPGGRAIPADIEVTAFVPNERVAFRVTAGPVRPEGEYRFSSAPAGTQVTFALTATLTGIKKLLMSKPVQKSMDSEMANLDTVKRLLEKDA
jgi:uncharacterized protein YndB with AHSA1/START domain